MLGKYTLSIPKNLSQLTFGYDEYSSYENYANIIYFVCDLVYHQMHFRYDLSVYSQ